MKKIFNIFNLNLFSKQLLLVELKDKQLILTVAKKKRLSGSIYIINVSNISIEQTIFRNGTIYQPSVIESHIKTFLDTQKLTKPQTFASIPDLSRKHDLELTLAVLQATLCISKTKVKILNITDASFFNEKATLIQAINKSNNLLDLLGHNKIRSPFPWLLSSTACLFAVLIGLRTVLNKNYIQISSLKNYISTLQCTTNKLTEQVKNFAQIKESNEQLKISLSKLENSYIHTQNPFNHIMEISCKIPTTDYLTKINFSKRPAIHADTIQKLKQKATIKNKTQNFPYIELEGQAKTIKSANHFIQLLAKNTDLFKKIDILYVKKIKYPNKHKIVKKGSKNTTPKYQFKAVGELKYIC